MNLLINSSLLLGGINQYENRQEKLTRNMLKVNWARLHYENSSNYKDSKLVKPQDEHFHSLSSPLT